VDGLWATKSKGVGLIVRAISFQDFQNSNLCDPDPATSQIVGQTDRQTDRGTDRRTTLQDRALH